MRLKECSASTELDSKVSTEWRGSKRCDRSFVQLVHYKLTALLETLI